MEPAVLAWVLTELHIGETSPLPEAVTPAGLDAFRRELVDKLTRIALPPN